MNQDIRVGPGDQATWGPITSRQDPRHIDFSGPVTFQMTIGLAGARVTVLAESNGYELEDITEVLLEGIDILPALDVQVHEDIRNHYERHAEQINRLAQQAAREAHL